MININKQPWVLNFAACNALIYMFLTLMQYRAVSVIPYDAVLQSHVFNLLLYSYVVIALITHCVILVTIPAMVLLLLTQLNIKARWIMSIAVIIFSIMLMLITVDQIVFKIYRYHLTGFLLQLILDEDANQIFALSSHELITAATICTSIVIFEIGLAYGLWRCQWSWLWRHVKLISSIVLGSACFCYGLIVLAIGTTPANIVEEFVAHGFIRAARPIPYFIESVYFCLPRELAHGLMQQGSDLFSQMEQQQKKIKYPLQPLKFQNDKHPYNVLIIGIDTWRYDMQNAEVTPNITHFAPQTIQFLNHFSGGNSTEPGLFSLFYSLPVSYWTSMLEQKTGPVLIHAFLQQGYHIGIFTSATNATPPYDQTLYREVPNLIHDTPADLPYQRDALITQEFQRDYLQNKSKHFFSFIFYNTAHSYCSPNPYAKPFQPSLAACERYALSQGDDLTALKNRYKNAVHYVDQQIGMLFTFLQQQNLLANTIVIITGDHGEEFNDYSNDRYGHAGDYTNAQIKTPLLIYWPHVRPRQITRMTSHYQITPWLLQWVLGCSSNSSDYAIEPAWTDAAYQRPWLWVGSYIGFGVRINDKIANVFHNGDYDITDLQGHIINARMDPSVFKAVFNMTQTYYTT